MNLVALRKESVDRNVTRGQLPTPEPPSLSARRAWIEICPGRIWSTAFAWSLSARRAWIEIRRRTYQQGEGRVALRKESVDRNISTLASYNIIATVALRKESVDRNTL